jgi:hypothetical protein
VFNKRLVTYLYEYYLLSIFYEYIILTDEPFIISSSNNEDTDNQNETDIQQGNIDVLKTEVAKLLDAYLKIMMKSKNTINVTTNIIKDKVFRLKESEKHLFTDRLKYMTEEARAVDTILKNNKLGNLYGIGISKKLRVYDDDIFEHDKEVADQIETLQNKIRKKRGDVDEMDVQDEIEQMSINEDIERDIYNNVNDRDDYADGDPWGDEVDDDNDYN